MESEITITKACYLLQISEPYFRKLLNKAGLKPIHIGNNVYYSEETLEEISKLIKKEKEDFFFESKYRMKALEYLENVPAGYTATAKGLRIYLGKKRPVLSILVSLDTVYEEEISHSVVLIGLTDNHVFVTEETDEETDKLIKSLCIRNKDIERIRRKNRPKEVFTPAHCAG